MLYAISLADVFQVGMGQLFFQILHLLHLVAFYHNLWQATIQQVLSEHFQRLSMTEIRKFFE